MTPSNYIEELASEIHSEVPPDLLPDGDTSGLFRIYAVLALAKGAAVTNADVHNAWSAWISASDPGHEAVEPYAELSPDVRVEDDPFVAAIRRVALRHATGS